MASVSDRSAKDKSWILNNSVADFAERMTMVFFVPSLNHITSPYLCLSFASVLCGIEPRFRIFPNIGHPGGPGGSLPWPEILRLRRKNRASGTNRAKITSRGKLIHK